MSARIQNIIAIMMTGLMLLSPAQLLAKDNKNTIKPKTTQQVSKSDTDKFIDSFIQEMVKKHHFKPDYLHSLFSKVTINKIVITKMNQPMEANPWHTYQHFFITEKRINGGVNYWQAHEKALTRAEKQFGVPSSVIVAILGVETNYGENKGDYSVLESLTTLAFNYPSRATFFKKELEQFLLLTREQKLDPLKITGSHAGAIGLPQFMPSSYREYAVDFSGTHSIDLVNSDEDAIGSIANFLKKHGWKKNLSIASKTIVKGDKFSPILATSYIPRTPSLTLNELKKHGVTPVQAVNSSTPMTFFSLRAKDDEEYWVGFKNFYVISRYNRNKHYVMAVYQLSQEIEKERKAASDIKG